MITEQSEQSPIRSFDFKKEAGIYDSIIADSKEEDEKVKTRRELRRNSVNVEEERQLKRILADETKIPDRTINTNIRRSKTPYIDYITTAQRMLVLTDVNNPSYDTEQVELWFTRGMRYPGWRLPWMRLVDAMLTHGGSAVEVVFDPEKPFNVAIEYIPRNCLLFPRHTKSIQACPRIIRKYHITVLELEELAAKYEFNSELVKKITDRFSKRADMLDIYRILSKKDGIVFSSWYSQDENSDWLRAPIEHQIGLFDIDMEEIQVAKADPQWDEIRVALSKPRLLKLYPIFWFKLDETEGEELLLEQGRVALDLHVQEALTSLLSSTVNASWRASQLYPSAENMPGDDNKMTELGPLKPGVTMSRKVVLNQFPWPQSIILAVMQALDIRKSAESGNTDFAAMARQDANKTKYEMELANAQSKEIASLDLTVFSTPYLDVLALCFLIAQHQAIFDLVPMPPNEECLYHSYHMQPAGDVEIIKRNEEKQNAKEFFEVVKGTPVAEKLIEFLFRKFFPDQAEEWIATMGTQEKLAQMQQTIMQLVGVLQQLPTDELDQIQQSGLSSLIASASAVAGEPSNAPVAQNPAPAPVGNAA